MSPAVVQSSLVCALHPACKGMRHKFRVRFDAQSSEKLSATRVLVKLAYRASQRFAPFYRHVCLLLKLNSEECKKADAPAV